MTTLCTAPALAGAASTAAASRRPRRSRSGREHARPQIAITAIANDRDDYRIVHFPRDAQPHAHRAARRDAGEQPLLARHAARRLLGVGLAHGLDAIDAGPVENLRQIRVGPLADARNLRAFLGFAADDLDIRILFLEVARYAHDGAGGAHAGHEVRDAALRVAPDFGSRAFG